MWAFARTAGFVLSGLLLAAAGPALAGMVSLSGEVTYRERIALPPGATLRVRLVDLTDAAAPPRVDVQAPIGSPGQVPLTFALNFDDLALTAGSEHGLLAEITAGNELWFHTLEPYRLDPLAPAVPVVVVTTFAGRIVAPGAAAEPEETGVPAAASDIVGITWRATLIGGNPVQPDVDSTLLIDADRRVGGRGGCNSYFAQADIAGSAIRFSAAAATRMACLSEAANAQEAAFFAALDTVRFWRLNAEGLTLLDDAENEVMRFAALTR